MNQEQLKRKEAKAAYKNQVKQDAEYRHKIVSAWEIEKESLSKIIKDGIMEGETVLDDNYPVYVGYLYVIEYKNGTGELYKCAWNSDVSRLIYALKRNNPDIKCLRRCNMSARNIF